jgi:diaminopimelate epimerase
MPEDGSRRVDVEFTKMTGAGNDFIVIDNRIYRFPVDALADLARRFCPRRTGVGADGLLALEAAEGPDTHFRMRYHNADGSVGTMCGNGARCLARYAFRSGIRHRPLRFVTDAGVYEADVPDDAAAPVRLHLPAPRGYRMLERGLHPDLPDGGHFIWTGTEHVVVFVPSVDGAPVETAGPELRAAREISGTGANVDFVEVAGPGELRVRTWEKGVEGETLACGTGATAAAVVACLSGRIPAGRVRVRMAGGELAVGVEGDPTEPDRLYLEGPAETVFRGTLEA